MNNKAQAINIERVRDEISIVFNVQGKKAIVTPTRINGRKITDKNAELHASLMNDYASLSALFIDSESPSEDKTIAEKVLSLHELLESNYHACDKKLPKSVDMEPCLIRVARNCGGNINSIGENIIAIFSDESRINENGEAWHPTKHIDLKVEQEESQTLSGMLSAAMIFKADTFIERAGLNRRTAYHIAKKNPARMLKIIAEHGPAQIEAEAEHHLEYYERMLAEAKDGIKRTKDNNETYKRVQAAHLKHEALKYGN